MIAHTLGMTSVTIFGDYIAGENRSSYVMLQDETPGTDQLSYPKLEFTYCSQTHQIDLRNGLWNRMIAERFDRRD